MRKISVYSLSTCPVCKKARKFLDDNNLPYTLIEVDSLDSSEQWAATRELARHNPDASYPTIVIEDVIKGFDPETLRARLL